MNRATRKDLLPLFYQTSKFALEYAGRTYLTPAGNPKSYDAPPRLGSGDEIVREPMTLTLESKAFLGRIPNRWLRLIKRFQLMVTKHAYSRVPLILSITVEVDRVKGIHSAIVKDVTSEGFRQVTLEKKVQKHLDHVMGKIRSRQASSADKADSCLRPSDFRKLRGHFEDIASNTGDRSVERRLWWSDVN